MSSVPDPVSGLEIGPLAPGGPAEPPCRTTVLTGDHVVIRALDPERDAAALWAASSGPEAPALFQYLAAGPFADEASFRAYLERGAASADPLFVTIADRQSGTALGHASYLRIDPPNRVIEVGNILFTPGLQRSAAATESMYLMARHAFDDLGYRRYEWKCNALNAPSRRAAERYGFVPEGLFRRHMIVKGRSRDTAWFSMIEDEWPARKQAFKRWLAPDNFDGDGRQILSLSALNAPALPAAGLSLRRATLADEDAFGALQQASFAWNRRMLGIEPLPLLVSPAEILGRYEVWLADGRDALYGAIALDPRPTDLEVWSIAVEPDMQNQGLGRQLLEAAEIRAASLGLSTLRLYTGAVLTKNIDWYGRRGYAIERTEERPDRSVVHMRKDLA